MLSIVNYQNIVSLFLSDEADTSFGGDQPARNNLTECNGKGERKCPNPIFLLQSPMPKKTLCFQRSKKKKKQVLTRKKVNVFWDKTLLNAMNGLTFYCLPDHPFGSSPSVRLEHRLH